MVNIYTMKNDKLQQLANAKAKTKEALATKELTKVKTGLTKTEILSVFVTPLRCSAFILLVFFL